MADPTPESSLRIVLEQYKYTVEDCIAFCNYVHGVAHGISEHLPTVAKLLIEAADSFDREIKERSEDWL